MTTHQQQVAEGRGRFQTRLRILSEDYFQENEVEVEYTGRHSAKIVYVWHIYTPDGRTLVVGASERAIDDPQQLSRTFELLGKYQWLRILEKAHARGAGLLVTSTRARAHDFAS